MNHWSPIDTVWRSTDGGATWKDIAEHATRDVSLSPYLFWGQKAPKLGWWMSALAIDPFDSDHAAYATGATIYATNNFSNTNQAEPTNWAVWADGIEETAVITLMSPTKGPHLLSGFGDIGGFVHDDLNASPKQGMYTNPLFGNTNTLDYAEQNPDIIVRSGSPHDGEAPLGWSDDGGRTWRALASPPSAGASAASASGNAAEARRNAGGRCFSRWIYLHVDVAHPHVHARSRGHPGLRSPDSRPVSDPSPIVSTRRRSTPWTSVHRSST